MMNFVLKMMSFGIENDECLLVCRAGMSSNGGSLSGRGGGRKLKLGTVKYIESMNSNWWITHGLC